MTQYSKANRTHGSKARPVWDVPLRILTASFGGYALTAAATALLARLLPGSPLETAMAATILSFALFTGAVVWTFGAGRALVVAGWIWGLALLTGGLAWLSIQVGGPA
ncbi:hypothetical protein [Niveispirillum cyanobacteriorum]|uniref:hypothetical protein n=1 Tax=Niveispirillum cyanobacteriorum TaxID=1612173 RepID=UPI0018F83BF2|nr:hypothetical protein [Niveispirillum cyanobacteriorum]GGE83109.1 hypothetical protein GCM10011317_45440 [Niveispirillum cyanobacteriorum]